MSFLVSLALVTSLLPQAPQGGGQDGAAAKAQGVLSPNERANLRKQLSEHIGTEAIYKLATGKDRDKARKNYEDAKSDFNDAWKKATAKNNVLGSMAELRAVFENCFTHKQPTITLGQLRPEKGKFNPIDFSFYLPKNYRSTTPARTVMVIPGTLEAGKTDAWTKPLDYFNATWDKSATSADSIFLLPTPKAGADLDTVPDLTRDAGEAEEQERILMLLGAFGEMIQSYNIERNRVFLDCGRGSCGFGVRMMTLFPDRFAGAVLRAPIAVDDIRLGSLKGIPFLLLRTAANAAVVDALAKRIDEVGGKTKTLDVSDEYPHKGHTAGIEAWLAEQRRTANPSHIVIEPNHDKFNNAYWADITTANILATSAPDQKPRLECIADRAANRITVKAVGVEKFTLYLNDELVDLDKEFTVVINDKASTEKKTRSFPFLLEHMLRRVDWEFLYPASVTLSVPK